MRRRIGLAIILASLLSLSGIGCSPNHTAMPRVYAQPSLDIGLFYDELAPYGRWIMIDGFGWVWNPYGTAVGWRPYTDGHWVWTDYGWTWVSIWRWGWAPFHYGRWHHHLQHGWVWIPGHVWGPGWVVWRRGPGWVGWAPLPPAAGWRSGYGTSISHTEIDRAVRPEWYSFVEERQLTSLDMRRHFMRAERNPELIGRTRNVTDYSTVNNRIVNRSIDVDRFEQETQQRVVRHRATDRLSPGADGDVDHVHGTTVEFYRPAIQDKSVTRVPRNMEPAENRVREVKSEQETQLRKLERRQAENKTLTEKQQRKLDQQQAQEKVRVEKQQRKEQSRIEQQRITRERQQQKRIERERQRQEKKAKKMKPPTSATASQPPPG